MRIEELGDDYYSIVILWKKRRATLEP